MHLSRAKTTHITPDLEGCKNLLVDNTVIMSHKFVAVAIKYGVKENRVIRNIRHDILVCMR